MDTSYNSPNLFYQFSTPILLIVGIVVSIIILLLNNKYYINYFFPELLDEIPDIQYIKKNINNNDSKYLIKGLLPLSNSEIIFNTQNNKSSNYVKIPKSINNEGGSQYTYSFWLNKKSSTEYANRIILLKGLKNDDIVVKSPLIKFGDNSTELHIEFNTSKKKNNIVKIGDNNNIFGITSGNDWYLVTIVFMDYVDYDTQFEKGVNVLVYLNGSLIDSGHVFKNDSLELNKGPLYILPSISGQTHYNLRGNISDLKYNNYALSQNEIEKIYKEGPNIDQFKTAVELTKKSSMKDTVQTRDLHILNELHQI
jgi:hypothetical protein